MMNTTETTNTAVNSFPFNLQISFNTLSFALTIFQLSYYLFIIYYHHHHHQGNNNNNNNNNKQNQNNNNKQGRRSVNSKHHHHDRNRDKDEGLDQRSIDMNNADTTRSIANCYLIFNEEERKQIIQRKKEFLQSYHGCVKTGWYGYGYGYGYTKNTTTDTCSKSKKRGHIDTWRAKEFPSLIHPILITNTIINTTTTTTTSNYADAADATTTTTTQPLQNQKEYEIYLDYAGSSIPSKTLFENIHTLSIQHHQILANPHSSGIAASRTLELMEQTKKKILDFFNAQPGTMYNTFDHEEEEEEEELDDHPGYDIIFTSGATESLQIIAENFKWNGDSQQTLLVRQQQQQQDSNKTKYNSMRSVLVYPQNVHTSVIGMRECTLSKGATFCCEDTSTIANANETTFQNWIQEYSSLSSYNEKRNKECTNSTNKNTNTEPKSEEEIHQQNIINHLLVLPLECNFGGCKIPNVKNIIKSSKKTQSSHTTTTSNNDDNNNNNNSSQYVHKWFTYLDIAKAACTQQINLKELDPDFACVSFYKIFGYPTGIGALLVKRSSKYIIQHQHSQIDTTTTTTTTDAAATTANTMKMNVERRYFGGGSVDVVLPKTDFSFPRSNLSASLTQGTVNFRGIVSLGPGLEEIESLGGMSMISNHTKSLAIEAVKRLQNLKHRNGKKAIVIYGQWAKFDMSDVSKQQQGDECLIPGPTVAFNIVRHDGSYVGYHEVSKLASLNRIPIQLRVGCFCNPGACQEALNLGDEEIKENYIQGGHVCGDDIDIINGKPTGAIRISFGKDSIFEDLDCFISFVEKVFVNDLIVTDEGCSRGSMRLPKEVILSEMYIYPIKSCAAMKVSQWNINRTTGAFRFDREFALVDSEGVALRLKTYPKMGLVQPSIDLVNKTLVVKGKGLPNLVVDLQEESYCKDSMTKEIRVCGNKCGGTIWGSHAASQWFSSFLGVQCWLARYKDSNGSRSGFENEAPILLVSKNAVDRLNKVMTIQGSKPVNAMFFRPNVVVDVNIQDDSSNPEDSWEKIVFPSHELEFNVIGPCARCAMVDIDPRSGCKGGKTLRALAQYRRDKGRINFGVFLSCSEKEAQDDACMQEGEKFMVKS